MKLLNQLIYTCTISDYNLSEFESCLQRKPSHLVLIVSDFYKKKDGPNLFESRIKEHIPSITIIRPDEHKGFSGSDLQEFKHWTETTLLNTLNTLPNYPRIANITGGTKAMTICLLNPSLGWQHLEYKAEQSQHLQLFNLEAGLVIPHQTTISLPVATALDVAKLHNKNAEQLPENPIIKQAGSLQAAEDLFSGLSTKQNALRDLFGNKNKGFEMVWKYGRSENKYKEDQLTFSSQEFIQQQQFNEQHLAWLKTWQSIAEQEIQYTNNSIIIPGNRSTSHFKKWLSGDWLEQLVAQWIDDKIENKVARNIRLRNSDNQASDHGERETDIVVHHKGRTSVIEIKTDLPPSGNFNDLLRQLISLRERVGRNTKILFTGPELTDHIARNKDSINARCEADGIIRCDSKASLLKALNIQ